MLIPTLQTKRLTLRAPIATDVDAFTAFFTSDRAIHVGGPLTERVAWRTFAAEIGHWHMLGFGMWTVTLKDTDIPLGLVGGWYPADWPEREIGWLIWSEAEGRGIAFEAATAAREYVFQTLNWSTAVSYIAPDNIRSIKLAERLGARLDETAAYPDGKKCLVYRHSAPEMGDDDGGVEAYS